MAQRISQIFLIVLLGFLGTSIMAQTEDSFRRTAITNPSKSRQCEILSEIRKQKITNKQRIMAMIQRNKHLQSIAPENKVTVKKKLETNLGRLEHELIITQTQIQYNEEKLVRKGCPGIIL